MRVTVAQMNPLVGDVQGNLSKITDVLSSCSRESPDLLVFPELFLVGYPPRDLLQRPWFIEKVQKAVGQLAEASRMYPQTGILLGTPWPTGKAIGKGLYNSAILICQGQIHVAQHKSLLPTYDVFEEDRYFDPAPEVNILPFKGEMLGVSICEDAWNAPELWPRDRIYAFDPVAVLARKGATLFINISASPFQMGKEEMRHRLICTHAQKHMVPFVYVNQVGANDELIFDGRSLCLDNQGQAIRVFPSFEQAVRAVDATSVGRPSHYVPQDEIGSVYEALILGIRDYTRKCGLSTAVIGLSGGIDSAVTCCLAAEALGSQNVLGVSMPSPYSSRASVDDARTVTENLGIEFKVILISPVFSSYLETLNEFLDSQQPGIAEENIQARIRGNILMAISNKCGHLVLSTGNKSELAVGYCTLYGDMSGGLSVLSDVPKTMVYELADYINRRSPIIPPEIIQKAPSAELRPDQVDQDTLPPYTILDQIIRYYVEEQYSAEEIIAKGLDTDTVRWVIGAIDRNEFKRRQAAPGLKVTGKAFGVGRRMPIAAKHNA